MEERSEKKTRDRVEIKNAVRQKNQVHSRIKTVTDTKTRQVEG